jgi:hypothetical protein
MGFDPVSLAVGTAVLGAGSSALGSIASGNAAAQNANYQSAIAMRNAVIAEQNAQHAIAVGQTRAQAKSLEGASKMGKIKASQAASGIDVNTGSAVDVQASERAINKLDTETVLNNAQLEAYGYRTQAANYLSDSQLRKQEASQAQESGLLGAATGVLNSVSKLPFDKF